MPRIIETKQGAYVIEVEWETEQITGANGTTSFVYLSHEQFEKLIEEGNQLLIDRGLKECR